MHSLLGIWRTTQACALTENRTSDPLVHRPALNPLSHTSQGPILPYDPKISLLGTYLKRPQTVILKECVHPCGHCSGTYNRQGMEAAQVPINR